jgi:hypothetical protein
MPRFDRGAAVQHAAYGRGTVTGVRHQGHEVQVSFGRFSLWVPSAELRPTSGGLRLVDPVPVPGPARGRGDTLLDELKAMLRGRPIRGAVPAQRPEAPREVPVPRYSPAVPGRTVEDACALEAFRMGIVPASRILEWTVGREAEVESIRTFLRDPAEGAILIEGMYGAGKSHLLAYLAQDAADLGFAVAMAGFDPSEATAAFPKKAYRRLVRNFRVTFDGEVTDFRGFLTALVARPGWDELLGSHPVLGPFLRVLAAGKADEDAWEWMEARGPGRLDLPTLHDYSTCANIYCNLLSMLGRASVEVLGLSGLAILLDEAEVARSVMYRYQALRGVNFFRGLVMTANDDPVLVEEGIARAEITTGERSGLIYSGHNPVRYSAGIPSYLKVAFALTPLSLREEFRRQRETIQVIEVDVLSQDQLRLLFHRICDRFQGVFGVGPNARDREHLFRLLAGSTRVNTTRNFIKGAVEILDFLRFYPDGDVDRMARGEWES